MQAIDSHQHSNGENERRSDNYLRGAIDRIKAVATPGAEVLTFYEQILRETLHLAQADYGLIATIPPSKHSHALVPRLCLTCTHPGEALQQLTLPSPMKPSPKLNKMLQAKQMFLRQDEESIESIATVFGDSISAHIAQTEPACAQQRESAQKSVTVKRIDHLNGIEAKTPAQSLAPDARPSTPLPPQFASAGIMPLKSESDIQLVIFVLGQKTPPPDGLATRLGALFLHANCALRVLDTAAPGSVNARFLANRHLVNLIRSSIHGIVTVDESLNITLMNPSAEQQFGAYTRDLLGKPLNLLFPTLTAEQIDQHGTLSKQHALRLGRHKQLPLKLQAKRSNLTRFPTEVVIFETIARDTRYKTLLIEDISEKAQLNQKFEDSLYQMRVLSDLAPVGIIQVDAQWHCVYANDHWMELSGLNKQETLGHEWINAISQLEVEAVLNNLSKCILTHCDYVEQLCLVSPIGKRRWVQMTARGLFDQSGQTLTGFLATFVDVSEQRKAQEKLREIAESDALTGLANRTLFTTRVQETLAQEKSDTLLAVLYIDLDGFKQVNDTYGHSAGDQLLRVVAMRLCQTVRSTDVVARLGGDEFAILLPNIPDTEVAKNVANNVLDTLANPIQIAGDIEAYVGASIGLAPAKPGETQAERLLTQADMAMYRAKTSGKNTTCLYTPALGSVVSQRMLLRNHLHRALEREELTVHYQPQVDLSTGVILGFESLLRWPHPEMGDISPADFVPVLEETGLIREVGIWVLTQACSALVSWRQLGIVSDQTTISVNVSAIQLHDKKFVDHVKEALTNSGLPPKALIIEITETALVQGSLSQNILDGLRKLGVKISLDDFGTGYSSLSYITRLPLDHLKIDQSFIARLPTDTYSVHVTKAIISMAKGMGLTVVAEGVDSRERLAMLASTECDIYQGFHFSKAITNDEIKAHLGCQRDARPETLKLSRKNSNNSAETTRPSSVNQTLWTCFDEKDPLKLNE